MLGEMVCAAGLLSREVGGVVLTQDLLSVDGDQRFDVERGEVGVGGELAVLPGFKLAQ